MMKMTCLVPVIAPIVIHLHRQVYTSSDDYIKRRKDLISTISKLSKKNDIRFDDPLKQLVTVPHFYLAFFGENDRDVYAQLAGIIVKSSPGGTTSNSLTYTAPHVLARQRSSSHTGMVLCGAANLQCNHCVALFC